MPSNPEEHFNYTINEWRNEPFTSLLDRLPSTIETIFDIGANAGGFTEVLKHRYPKSDCYCFEPIKETFDYLKKKLPYAKCFQCGIYYGQTSSRAVWRGSNIGAYFVEHIDAGDDKIITDLIMPLRELESFDIVPDLIKLDVEGAELNIIENSKLIKQTPYLIIEWHPDLVNPVDFFEKHLPKHKIVFHIEHKQWLLTLK